MKKHELIERDIKHMITQCILSPGDKLPSIRSLSKQYGVSISPVKAVYDRLVEQHWIEVHPRSGYYVSEAVLEETEIRNRAQYLHGNSSERYDLLETVHSGLGRSFNAKNNISLALGSTTASLGYYACEDIDHHISQFMHGAFHPNDNLQTVLHDSVDLKKQILRWSKSNGLDFGIDTLSIVPNASAGILLALRTVAEPGSSIAVESPGHAGFYFATTILNYKVIPVSSDPVTGLNIDDFERILNSIPSPSCLLLSSTFSSPTGAVMPDESKRRLTDICSRFHIPIIEDDVMGDLYYGQTRPMPLKSFDNENVIYISGFTKSLNPVFRMGYVCAGKYSERFAFYKHLMVSYALFPIQLGMASFLSQGNAYNYIRLFRRRLSTLKDNYREIILSCFPESTNVSNPSGGLFLWVSLPASVDSERLSNLAENYGISISPSRLFGAPPSMKSSFRLNIAAVPWNSEARAAIKTLGQLACSMHKDAEQSKKSPNHM